MSSLLMLIGPQVRNTVPEKDKIWLNLSKLCSYWGIQRHKDHPRQFKIQGKKFHDQLEMSFSQEIRAQHKIYTDRTDLTLLK